MNQTYLSSETLLNLAKQVKSLADTGLVFNPTGYDAERYEQLQEIAVTMISALGATPVEVLNDFYLPETDYPTPKVDIRGFVMNAQKEILLVKEKVDGKWTLPGGWADIGMTPAEVVVKEVEEETGLQVEPVHICAVYDKRCHPHPPQAHYVYKIFFYCELKGGSIDPNFDILDVGWCAIDDLPELSADRIVKGQLEKIYQNVIKNGQKTTLFDSLSTH